VRGLAAARESLDDDHAAAAARASLRKAVSHAIDRKALIAGTQFGLARLASCMYPDHQEIHRTAGEIALMSSEPDATQAHFERAIAIAPEQKAKSWELRAATSVARLWRATRAITAGPRFSRADL